LIVIPEKILDQGFCGVTTGGKKRKSFNSNGRKEIRTQLGRKRIREI